MSCRLNNIASHANSAALRGRLADRRGMAVVVVMLLLSMTLALSYTVMRSQSTSLILQGNTNLDGLAKQAAQAGLAIALRKMSDGTWGGVGSTTVNVFTTNQSYTYGYQTGDASLTATSPNYADWPYRVTIGVTGKATDPTRPGVSAIYGAQAIVRLMPRQLATPPTTLTTAVNYTAYQIGNSDFELQLPCQVVGPVRVQGDFRLCDTYPGASYGLSRYLGDLNSMRTNGYGDFRPVTGPVSVPSSRISGSTSTLLTTQLGVSKITISSTSTSGWSFPGTVSSYQLYAGGQTYTVPTLSATLANATFTPDAKSNPLGIYFRNGSITLNNNVNITGTIIANGDVTLSGTGIVLAPPNLAGPVGSSQPAQFPCVVANGNFRVTTGASATVRGLVAVWSDFDCAVGSASTMLDFQGRVISNGFKFEERSDWNIGSFWWSMTWSWFNSQLSGSNPITYYPVFVSALWGVNPDPNLTVAPEASPVTYLWKDQTNTPYVPAAADAGLRWQVLSWTETP